MMNETLVLNPREMSSTQGDAVEALLAPNISTMSIRDYLSALPASERAEIVTGMSPDERRALREGTWEMIARPDQRLNWDDPWTIWLMSAGRRFGKTRAGAEAVNEMVLKHGVRQLLLLGQTVGDAADIMVNGPAGIIACSGGRAEYKASSYGRPSVLWDNGAEAHVRSAEKAGRIRGLGVEVVWADELGQFISIGKGEDDAWAMAEMALDRGIAREIVTTTPKRGNRSAQKLLRKLKGQPGTRLTLGSTDSNRANISQQWFKRIEQNYGGTQLEQQERHGEILDELEGALFNRQILTQQFRQAEHAPKWYEVDYFVIGIDPAVGASTDSDFTGVAAGGRLGDAAYLYKSYGTRDIATKWAKDAGALFDYYEADDVIYEQNGIGAMTPEVFTAAAVMVNLRPVVSLLSKGARAMPVVGMFESRRVWLVGGESEHQMFCDQAVEFTGDAQTQTGHDDVVDCVVHVCRDLLLREQELGLEALTL